MDKWILIFFATICIASCTNSEKKEQIGLKKNDIRIVSLVPSITTELVSLGVRDQIVGATSYCDITKQDKKLIVGSATEVNIEKILVLKPDIVFAYELNSEKTIQTLRNNKINVVILEKLESFDDICNHFLKLGEYVGKKNTAHIIIRNCRNKIDSMVNKISFKKQKPKMFFQIGANPIFTVLPKTYMQDLILLSGCENIANGLEHGSVTREFVLKSNPDIIFVTTMGIMGMDEKKNWEKFTELNAVKTRRIFIIESEFACIPTVLAFTKSLEIIFEKLH